MHAKVCVFGKKSPAGFEREFCDNRPPDQDFRQPLHRGASASDVISGKNRDISCLQCLSAAASTNPWSICFNKGFFSGFRKPWARSAKTVRRGNLAKSAISSVRFWI